MLIQEKPVPDLLSRSMAQSRMYGIISGFIANNITVNLGALLLRQDETSDLFPLEKDQDTTCPILRLKEAEFQSPLH